MDGKLHTDVVVIGAGHAGCEAALAVGRLGCQALLVSMNLDAVAQMSCNPAIGGLAKGQLVREIDALGGVMGVAADATGIQFRMLNSAKGPAVRSPRAQADKWAYQHWVKHFVEQAENVALRQDRVVRIVVEGGEVVGVTTALGMEIPCRAVIVCTGTFPAGRIHVGTHQSTGGRFGEPAAQEISENLQGLGLPLIRLKTGTCPRITAGKVDFSRLQVQPGDDPPHPFSYLTRSLEVEQVPCHTTYTTPQTHRIVQQALTDAPVFSGQIQGTGPRYCPSLELKIARFPDRERHHIYVEPEGRHTQELYLNGLSTSLSPEIQVAVVRSIPGLEEARISRFGYAVEYDAISPRALRDTLEVKAINGLYTAGQVNGTSGYEEAAAQGLVAGANAALKIQGREPFRLSRDQAYIGVLVDDLVTRGVDEPYRLFTSRAEYRLLLRQDNADLRLTPLASELGLVSHDREDLVAEVASQIAATRNWAESTRVGGKSLFEHLRRPEYGWEDVCRLAGSSDELPRPPKGDPWVARRASEQVAIEAQYEGYIRRHLAQIRKVSRATEVRIPTDFDYASVDGMRLEAREKLALVQPETLGQAGRVSGVSPADMAVLSVRVAQARARVPESTGG